MFLFDGASKLFFNTKDTKCGRKEGSGGRILTGGNGGNREGRLRKVFHYTADACQLGGGLLGFRSFGGPIHQWSL